MSIHLFYPALTLNLTSYLIQFPNLIHKQSHKNTTYVSENDFLVFLCRFETTILAANYIHPKTQQSSKLCVSKRKSQTTTKSDFNKNPEKFSPMHNQGD